MKNLKPLCIAVSFLFFSSTLFSQIKPVNKVLKVDNVSKTDIKLKDYILSNNALKVDEIEGLSVEDIEGLKIPKVTPVDFEVLNSIKLKESWEVSPKQLNDGGLTFKNMSKGSFSLDDGFTLYPYLAYREIERERFALDSRYEEYVAPSSINFIFKQREGDMYLLEVRVYSTGGKSSLGAPYFQQEQLNAVIIGRNGEYQTHAIVDGKATMLWTAKFTGELNIKIKQHVPTSNRMYELSCKAKVSSMKIRNITE